MSTTTTSRADTIDALRDVLAFLIPGMTSQTDQYAATRALQRMKANALFKQPAVFRGNTSDLDLYIRSDLYFMLQFARKLGITNPIADTAQHNISYDVAHSQNFTKYVTVTIGNVPDDMLDPASTPDNAIPGPQLRALLDYVKGIVQGNIRIVADNDSLAPKTVASYTVATRGGAVYQTGTAPRR